MGVVLASGGYPGSYEKGKVITGVDANYGDDIRIYHAGTKYDAPGLVTSGGRVLCVSALAPSFTAARDRAYSVGSAIQFDGMYYRRDIGARALRGRSAWD